VEVAARPGEPRLRPYLAEAPSAWQGPTHPDEEPAAPGTASSHIRGKEPGSCRVPFSDTVQSEGCPGALHLCFQGKQERCLTERCMVEPTKNACI